jgi:hypothetical protein
MQNTLALKIIDYIDSPAYDTAKEDYMMQEKKHNLFSDYRNLTNHSILFCLDVKKWKRLQRYILKYSIKIIYLTRELFLTVEKV